MYRQSEKNLLNSNTSSTCPDNIVHFSLLTADICWRVWGTPANFNRFCVLAVLLHGTLLVGVSQTLWRWTEGATYIWQGAITLGIGPHFEFCCFFLYFKHRNNGTLRLTYKKNADVLRHIEACCTKGHHDWHDNWYPHDSTFMPHYERLLHT